MEYDKLKAKVEKRIIKRDEAIFSHFVVGKVAKTSDKIVRTSYIFDAEKIALDSGVSDIVAELQAMPDSESRGELKKETLKELRAYARATIE